MVISRFVKIIGGAVGTGIVAILCYHLDRSFIRHFDQNQNLEDTPSDSSGLSFNSMNIRQRIGLGLTTARFLRDMYDILMSRGDPPSVGNNGQPQIQRDNNQNDGGNNGEPLQIRRDPAGGDAGENAPSQPPREEVGGGDATYYIPQ